MYMDELEAHFRRENGQEAATDIPVTGDISEDSDLGVKVENVE
jgi:hypothetical protein